MTALVVASRGGTTLQATLASLGWAARCRIADPAGVLAASGWPAGVEPWTAGDASEWILLLAEGEVATPALETAIGRASDGKAMAYRIAMECHAFGASIRLIGRPVRLVRGADHEIRVALGGEIAFAVAGAVGLLGDASIARHLPSLPAEAVDALNAEAAMLAALASARGVRPRMRRLAFGGLAGTGRVLFGRGRGRRLGWGRWIAAVLAGYRGLLAEAKLWERTQLGVPPLAK